MSIVPKALANGCQPPPANDASPASDRPSPIQRNERAGSRPNHRGNRPEALVLWPTPTNLSAPMFRYDIGEETVADAPNHS